MKKILLLVAGILIGLILAIVIFFFFRSSDIGIRDITKLFNIDNRSPKVTVAASTSSLLENGQQDVQVTVRTQKNFSPCTAKRLLAHMVQEGNTISIEVDRIKTDKNSLYYRGGGCLLTSQPGPIRAAGTFTVNEGETRIRVKSGRKTDEYTFILPSDGSSSIIQLETVTSTFSEPY